MTATATSTAVKSKVDEVLTSSVRAQAQRASATKATDSASNAIKSNTFYKIVFDANVSAEDKVKQLTSAFVYSGTKEEARERMREFEAFKEYLQAQRSNMAQQIINLTDTEAFSELKKIYDELNSSLLDFDEKMAPLTEIIDAVYTLRTNGKTLEAFEEIKREREAEAARDQKRQGFNNDVSQINNDINTLNAEIARNSQDKSFFGLGKIKPEAQSKIDEAKRNIAENMTRLDGIRNELVALKTEDDAARNKQGEFAAEKAKLRELLDITSEGHKERQEALVKAALNFVNTAHDRIGAVREHLGQMNDQVENLGDANSGMTQIYAMLNDSIKVAEGDNQKIREQLNAPEGEETLIAKMKREERQKDVDNHMRALDATQTDTMLTYSDLTTQTIRIRAMKESNDEQIIKARALHTQGVAGVADRLSTVLQAVSSAAINESSSMASDTLAAMSDKTNTIAQKEVIRVATGMSDRNVDMQRAIDSLASYGEVRRAATNITREGVAEMKEWMGKMEAAAEDVQKSIKDSTAVHASSVDDAAPATTVQSTGGLDAAFKNLG